MQKLKHLLIEQQTKFRRDDDPRDAPAVAIK